MNKTLLTLFIILTISTPSFAQVPTWPQIAQSIIKDPTTYIPAGVGYVSTRLDWSSSEVFTSHGWLEKNPAFTKSGLPNDVALSQSDGNRKILSYTLQNLAQSAIANGVERVMVEKVLVPLNPSHEKALKRVGMGIRWGLCAYLTYTLSHDHLVQYSWNLDTSHNLGWR